MHLDPQQSRNTAFDNPYLFAGQKKCCGAEEPISDLKTAF
jgi:hypothetical protein